MHFRKISLTAKPPLGRNIHETHKAGRGPVPLQHNTDRSRETYRAYPLPNPRRANESPIGMQKRSMHGHERDQPMTTMQDSFSGMQVAESNV